MKNKKNLKKKISKTISKKLGITRQLSQYEEAYIEKVDHRIQLFYGYYRNSFKRKQHLKANPNFDYLDKLLTDWHDRKFSTIDQIQKFLNDIKQKKNKNIKNLEKKSGYQNYDQRNYDNLNTLYANNI